MAGAAVKRLQQNTENGFFLMVEGARIDHAHHENDARRSLEEAVQGGSVHCEFPYRRGEANYWVKGFCACYVMKLAFQRGEGEREECKYQNKEHRTFDPRNKLTPLYNGFHILRATI